MPPPRHSPAHTPHRVSRGKSRPLAGILDDRVNDPGGPDKLPDDLAPIDMPLYIAYNVTMDKGCAHGGKEHGTANKEGGTE